VFTSGASVLRLLIVLTSCGLAATGCQRASRRQADEASTRASDTSTLDPSMIGRIRSAPPSDEEACDEELYRAPAGERVDDLTQTRSMLLWRESRGIMAWPKPSGPARVLLALERPRELAVDEQYAYVAMQGSPLHGLYRIPLSGGAPERMATAGGMLDMIDDVLVNATHVIMSRNMGEIVRVSKEPPFALQAYSRRDQRRDGFGAWAVSDHAVWFDRPGRGLGGRVFASGASALLLRGTQGMTVNPTAQRHELFVLDEGTGAVQPTAWWSGSWAFGFALDQGRVAFSTVLEAPANAPPTNGWLFGALGQAPPARFRACPRGASLTRTPLHALLDRSTIYAQVSDHNNQHAIVRVTAR
jgi:hypothetical protein